MKKKKRHIGELGKAQYHAESRLPDGLIVDKEIAQIISYLKQGGVQTVECCIDGWGSGYAYVIVETIHDLDLSADILGHNIDLFARGAVMQCLTTGELFPGAQSLVTPSKCQQCDGPWWPSRDWFVGAVWEPGRICPVLGLQSAMRTLSSMLLLSLVYLLSGFAAARLSNGFGEDKVSKLKNYGR